MVKEKLLIIILYLLKTVKNQNQLEILKTENEIEINLYLPKINSDEISRLKISEKTKNSLDLEKNEFFAKNKKNFKITENLEKIYIKIQIINFDHEKKNLEIFEFENEKILDFYEENMNLYFWQIHSNFFLFKKNLFIDILIFEIFEINEKIYEQFQIFFLDFFKKENFFNFCFFFLEEQKNYESIKKEEICKKIEIDKKKKIDVNFLSVFYEKNNEILKREEKKNFDEFFFFEKFPRFFILKSKFFNFELNIHDNIIDFIFIEKKFRKFLFFFKLEEKNENLNFEIFSEKKNFLKEKIENKKKKEINIIFLDKKKIKISKNFKNYFFFKFKKNEKFYLKKIENEKEILLNLKSFLINYENIIFEIFLQKKNFNIKILDEEKKINLMDCNFNEILNFEKNQNFPIFFNLRNLHSENIIKKIEKKNLFFQNEKIFLEKTKINFKTKCEIFFDFEKNKKIFVDILFFQKNDFSENNSIIYKNEKIFLKILNPHFKSIYKEIKNIGEEKIIEKKNFLKKWKLKIFFIEKKKEVEYYEYFIFDKEKNYFEFFLKKNLKNFENLNFFYEKFSEKKKINIFITEEDFLLKISENEKILNLDIISLKKNPKKIFNCYEKIKKENFDFKKIILKPFFFGLIFPKSEKLKFLILKNENFEKNEKIFILKNSPFLSEKIVCSIKILPDLKKINIFFIKKEENLENYFFPFEFIGEKNSYFFLTNFEKKKKKYFLKTKILKIQNFQKKKKNKKFLFFDNEKKNKKNGIFEFIENSEKLEILSKNIIFENNNYIGIYIYQKDFFNHIIFYCIFSKNENIFFFTKDFFEKNKNFEKQIFLKNEKIFFSEEKFEKILEKKNFENEIDFFQNENLNFEILQKKNFFCGFNNYLEDEDFLVFDSFLFGIVEEEVKVFFDSGTYDEVLI